MKIKAMRCPTCGDLPTARRTILGWFVICDRCYDGAPDGGPQWYGASFISEEAAVEHWNETIEEETMQTHNVGDRFRCTMGGDLCEGVLIETRAADAVVEIAGAGRWDGTRIVVPYESLTDEMRVPRGTE